MYFLIHPWGRINDEGIMSGCTLPQLGMYIPSDLEISLIPQASPSGNLLVVGDVQPNQLSEVQNVVAG